MQSRHALHVLIGELTSALTSDPADHVARRVRYALALVHATVESLEELEASYGQTWRRRGGRQAPTAG